MKPQSIHRLFRVKKLVLQAMSTSCRDMALQAINSVLLDEEGADAVLYPYANETTGVLSLWCEGMMPKAIALKTGIAQDIIEDIIEDPANYLRGREQLAHL